MAPRFPKNGRVALQSFGRGLSLQRRRQRSVTGCNETETEETQMETQMETQRPTGTRDESGLGRRVKSKPISSPLYPLSIILYPSIGHRF